MAAANAKFEGRDYQAHALLVHVFKEHPPKNSDALSSDLDRDDTSSMKKAIRNAVITYNPDQNHNMVCGMEWHVLCTEISKLLNSVYERYK